MAQQLAQQLQQHFGDKLQSVSEHCDQITIEVAAEHLQEVCYQLRDVPAMQFDILIDLCAVDYSEYGVVDWATDSATETGFSRGVEHDIESDRCLKWDKSRFAVVYHLLSIAHNRRLRLRVNCDSEEPPVVESVIDIWNAANWFEREAYDLYGILFAGHPDLRRLLTDYGFIGHPFRKDFPMVGEVEMRYDDTLERVVYGPVEIEMRTLVPKVVRSNVRYADEEQKND